MICSGKVGLKFFPWKIPCGERIFMDGLCKRHHWYFMKRKKKGIVTHG